MSPIYLICGRDLHIRFTKFQLSSALCLSSKMQIFVMAVVGLYRRVLSCIVHAAMLSPGYRSLTVLLTTPKYLRTSAGIPFPLRGV